MYAPNSTALNPGSTLRALRENRQTTFNANSLFAAVVRTRQQQTGVKTEDLSNTTYYLLFLTLSTTDVSKIPGNQQQQNTYLQEQVVC